MFTILGADQRQYGPVPAEKIREWIAQRRADGQTQVRVEGSTEWRRLASFPEFAEVLGQLPASPPPLSGSASSAPSHTPLPSDIKERDYVLDLGACFSRAWDTITGPQAWLIIGGGAIWLLIQMGLGGLGAIPIVGPGFSLANIVIAGPLMGGVYWFMLRGLRGQEAGIENLFDGFRYRFVQLLLANLMITILSALAMIPGGLVIAISVVPMVLGGGAAVWAIGPIVLGAFLILVPLVFLGVSWIYTLPLIVDKRLDFWVAMETSRKVVMKHWFLVFILLILSGIVSVAGVLLCCVGWFFTAPLGILALLAGYDSIFSPKSS